jgi:hypothetical protein
MQIAGKKFAVLLILLSVSFADATPNKVIIDSISALYSAFKTDSQCCPRSDVEKLTNLIGSLDTLKSKSDINLLIDIYLNYDITDNKASGKAFEILIKSAPYSRPIVQNACDSICHLYKNDNNMANVIDIKGLLKALNLKLGTTTKAHSNCSPGKKRS